LAFIIALTTSGCAVRRTTHVPPSQVPPPVLDATAEELLARVNAQSEAIRTMVATVDLEPTAGSVYSGVIREYRDVRGFILVERPSMIRMVGQAPVVRTNIFDMASDGKEFRLYIPLKQKFIVGREGFRRPAKNQLENMRPQHILDALLIPPVDSEHEEYATEEAQQGLRRFYVLMVLARDPEGGLQLRRKIWFDRSDLEIVRLQLFGPGGSFIEDVHYYRYQPFEGARYPSSIQVIRPVEDYRLTITVLKATFNQPIGPEKFELARPEGAELVELSENNHREEARGQ
jgi:outer membrane lipoprotein-sorting protein